MNYENNLLTNAIQEVKTQEQVDTIGKSYINLAKQYLNSNPDSTLHYAQKALNIGLTNKDSSLIGYGNYYLGKSYFYQRKFQDGFKFLRESYQIAAKASDSLLIIKSGINLINYSNIAGDFNEAQKVFNETINVAIAYNDPEYILILNANMGILYDAIDEYDLALHYYTEALKIALSADYRKQRSALFNNIGTTFISKQDYNSAIEYLKKALKIHIEDNNWNKLAMVYNNFSDIYLKKKEYDSALYYSKQVLTIAKKEEVSTGTLNSNYCNLGEIYLRKNEAELARMYLDTSEQRAIKFNDIDVYPETLLLKSQWNEKYGNLEKAILLLKKHFQYKDSTYKSNRIINTLNKEYETNLESQKEKIFDLEVLYDKQKIKTKSLGLWIWVASFIILTFIIWGYIFYIRSKSKELAILKEAAENKLEALQNQMNPHFVFNSFNAIQHHIITSNKKKASEYLVKISKLIRNILSNSSKMEIDFEEEIELLKNYVELEAMRFQGKFTYDFNISDELLEENPTIPSMLLQPIIENAIIHGLANKHTDDGKLIISAETTEINSILFTITDNGIGRKKAQAIKKAKASLMHHASIAENNIKTRLQILKKIGYPNNKITTEDLYTDQNIPSGTRVLLEINKIT